ncbi:hypothetical protein AB0I60_10050 [Actinosynnema sp. NPDC050436]|uniref:hypothetical protein n=1 Tax=Actinosynnema sp. NPDC050436 TaxID=3155659 RepID=UPI0033E5A4E5
MSERDDDHEQGWWASSSTSPGARRGPDLDVAGLTAGDPLDAVRVRVFAAGVPRLPAAATSRFSASPGRLSGLFRAGRRNPTACLALLDDRGADPAR